MSHRCALWRTCIQNRDRRLGVARVTPFLPPRLRPGLTPTWGWPLPDHSLPTPDPSGFEPERRTSYCRWSQPRCLSPKPLRLRTSSATSISAGCSSTTAMPRDRSFSRQVRRQPGLVSAQRVRRTLKPSRTMPGDFGDTRLTSGLARSALQTSFSRGQRF